MGRTVLEIQAKDNASQVIDGVKQSIDGVKQSVEGAANSSKELDKIKQQFDKITSATMPPRKELRELQQIMARMNLNNLANTDVFTDIAQRAGELKDAMADASDAMNRYASDTFTLEATAQAFQGIAAAGSIATGVIGMLGVKNEDLQRILVKVQAAQSVLNGVTAIANILNKDSALMLKIKAIRSAASRTATVAETAATNANTVAQVANKGSLVAGTAAQTAWNTAKAIGKAMVGDFTGLLLLGIGALTTYAIATADSSEKNDENSESMKRQKREIESLKETTNTYVSGAASAYANLMTKYDDLRDSWNKLKSAKEKNQFLKDNKTKIEELTTAVKGVDSAENFFKDKTGDVVKAFRLRAQAAGAAALQVDLYRRAMEAEMNKKYNMRGNIVDETSYNRLPEHLRRQLQVQRTERRETGETEYHPGPDGGYRTKKKVDVPVAWKIPENASEELLDALNKAGAYNAAASKEYQRLMEQVEWADKKHEELLDKANKLLAPGTTTKGNGGGHTPKPDKKDDKKKLEPVKDSVQDLRNRIQDMQTLLSYGLIPADKIEVTKANVKKLQEELEKKEIELGLREPKKADVKKFAKGSVAAIQEEIQNLQNRLNNENLTADTRLEIVSKIDDLQKKVDAMTSTKDLTIKAEVEPTIVKKGSIYDKRESYQNAQNKASQIQSDLDSGLIDTKTAKSQIAEINKEIAKIGGKPIQIEIETDWNKFMDGADAAFSAVGAIDGVVNSVSRLSDALSGDADAWTTFMAAVSVVESVLTAVNTVMEISNMLSGLSAASKATEAGAAIAAGTATTEQAAMEAAAVAPKTAQTVANKALEASILDLAAAEIFAAHAAIPFVGPGIAAGLVTGMMAAMAAQHAASLSLQALAEGGVVKGQYTLGDYNIIRANAGEMVLNTRQQANLFKAIDENRIGGEVVNGGQVEFVIRGDKLYGVLKNYEKINR